MECQSAVPTRDGYKEPSQCQQSDGSQLKEDAFSQSTVTKTATESCSSAMHQQPFPENDFHNCKLHVDWKTMLRESREKKKVRLKKDKRSNPQLGQQKESSNTEAVLKNASIRVETAADQGNGDDHEKGGQAKPNDDGKSQTSTWQNQQAVRGMCQDDGFQVHRNFDVSMPGRGALTTQGVRQGGPQDVIDLADLIEQLKNRNPDELRGYHQGVLLHKKLKPSNQGQYRQGEQYIFVRQLGEGAFGVADLLKDKTSGKYFVGKRVPFWKFKPSEPKLSSRLVHRFIVRFLGLLCTDNKVMLLSKFKPGSKTLLEIIHQSVLGPVRALRILQRLLVVVYWLHSTHQIVHMDIKADNILILPGDRVQLIDFGLSREQIAESQLYGMDVQSLGCTLVHMITGLPYCSHPVDFDDINTVLLSHNVHPDVRHLVVQMVSGELTAAQALKIANELCRTLATERGKPEPGLMDVQHALPLTPRGPENDSYRLPQQDCPPANRPAHEVSLSTLCITTEADTRRDDQIEMEVEEEEDMYGPPKDPDSPKIFNEGAFQLRSSDVRSGTSAVGPHNVARQSSRNAANFDLQLNSCPSNAWQNSWTTSNLMPDNASNPLDLSVESQSMEEWNFTSTEHARMLGAGQKPSPKGPPEDEPDIGGTVGFATGTSGFVSNLTGNSTDDQHSVSLKNAGQSTSRAPEVILPCDTYNKHNDFTLKQF